MTPQPTTDQSSNPPKPRILVAGQVPPPICGQNISIQRVLRLLPQSGKFQVDHWKFNFTPDWSKMRSAGPGKVIELFRVLLRLLRLRSQGPIHAILYPVGGPHLTPIMRDIAVLPLALLLSEKVVLHFRAAGLAEALPILPKPIAYLLKKLYQKCDHALALSEYGKRDPKSAGISHIEVLPNASEDTYSPDLKNKNTNPGKESKEDTINILHAGLLCADKGTPNLIQAFAQLHQTYPSTRLQLAGQLMPDLQPEEDFLHQLETLGIQDAVTLSGVLDKEQLHQSYDNSHLFVFSTVAPFESFGNVLAESMMWKLPIVATDWRANSEVLGPDFGGELAPVGETSEQLTEGLHQALERLIKRKSEWPQMGETNRQRYLSTYEIEPHRKQLETYFLNLLKIS